jgi:transcriptional regulator with XRE-family HTH domain
MAARKREKSLGEQLRGLIEDSGLTNYELGRRAGVTEAGIWRFRKGQRDITLETAGRLCDALGVEPLRARRSAVRSRQAAARESSPQDRDGPAGPGDDM